MNNELPTQWTRNVEQRVSDLMGKQADDLGLASHVTLLRYMILLFDVLFRENGKREMQKMVAEVLEADESIRKNIMPRKSFCNVDPDAWELYAGYATLMKCGGQAEFLRYLVLQHQDHVDTMSAEDLQAVVDSYLGVAA